MKRILVCLDKSSAAPEVQRVALDVARTRRAKVRLLRIIEGAGEFPESNDVLVANATADLDRLARNVPGDLFAGSRAVISETPWKAICEVAREEKADLIVIGAHAHGRVARALGTTAANVVNHADRPVLVVRSPEERPMESGTQA
jgi:nucleotide-binding universal stress UspA family protein